MTDRLKEYTKKRDFEKTGEPDGDGGDGIGPEQTLRFVVQHHIASRDHYDFRLEWKGVLLSWAVPKGPSYNPQDKRLAIRVEDHPFGYKDFEGSIPQGQYGGGTVMLWDEGFWLAEYGVDKALAKGELKFALLGKRLIGKWGLFKLKDGARADNWLLIKEQDEYAEAAAGIAGFTTSIRTGRTMAEIGKNT